MNIGSTLAALPFHLNEVGGATAAPASSGASFGDLFTKAINGVDSLQSGADAKISNLLQGAPNTDVGGVTVAVEKADVAFQLMMQVRNKVVSAYQDIEKMQF